MVPFFKTNKISFLIPPLYDTSGNNFSSPESKLFLENAEVAIEPAKFYFNDAKYTFSGIGYYSSKLFKSSTYGSKPLALILRKNIELNNVSFELYNGIWRDIGTQQRLQEINFHLFE